MVDLKKDIELGLRKYPTLFLVKDEERVIVKGNFIATDSKSKIEIEAYEVVISFPRDYPNLFPIVTEVSGKIPKEMDRHVRPDGTLCFSNPQEEFRICRNGITFIWFLKEILNAHLCREFVREKTGVYPTGERSHGVEGIWEEYYDIFNTKDKQWILTELNQILQHPHFARNALCYCDSGKKYKVCHERIEAQILIIGRDKLQQIIRILTKNFSERDHALQ